ncbi:MAG: fibronectin type III domain-containing protein [Ruminococcaceae bacterium]|nr:fibronectin type III domain-containing protein [Oscillospiraceae bacterium]
MMRTRKICVIMLAIVMLLSSYTVMADTERIQFGEATVQTVEGVTTVTVPLVTKPAGKGATLIAAYMHPDTGRILSINATPCADVSLLSENSISVSLEDKSSDGGVLSCYVWDSLSGNMSLLNASPAAPEDLTAGEESISTAKLTWEAPLDDYDESEDLTYNIYDEGMLIKEDCASLEYTAGDLVWGTDYNFEVRAVDTDGAESVATEVSATTTMKNTVVSTSESVTTTGGNYEILTSSDGNLIFEAYTKDASKNFSCEKTTESGLDCYKTVFRSSNNSPTGLAYYFKDSYYSEIENADRLVCELTYFDEGTGDINLTLTIVSAEETDKSDATKWKTPNSYVMATRNNTKTWKTVRKEINIEDGYVLIKNNNGNGYYSVKLRPNSGTDLIKVHSFSVIPLYETAETEEYYTTIKKNAGAYFTADGATITCDMTSTAEGKTPETVAERGGIKLSSLAGNKFDFTVKDTTLQSGNVKVVISYYAPEEGTEITLGSETKEITASKKWQKMCFDVSDIGSSANYITASEDIYINCVRVVAAD